MTLGGLGMGGLVQGYRQADQDQRAEQKWQQQQELNEQQMGLNALQADRTRQQIEAADMQLEMEKPKLARIKFLQQRQEDGGLPALHRATQAISQGQDVDPQTLTRIMRSFKMDDEIVMDQGQDGQIRFISPRDSNTWEFQSPVDMVDQFASLVNDPQKVYAEIQAQVDDATAPRLYFDPQSSKTKKMTPYEARRADGNWTEASSYEQLLDWQSKQAKTSKDQALAGKYGAETEKIRKEAKKAARPDIKYTGTFAYTQDGRPIARQVESGGQRYWMDPYKNTIIEDDQLPEDVVLGGKPKTPDAPKTGAKSRAEALNEFGDILDVHDEALEMALRPFQTKGGKTFSIDSDGGLRFTDEGSEALNQALDAYQKAKEKPAEKRNAKEKQAMRVGNIYDKAMADIEGKYNPTKGMPAPSGTGLPMPSVDAQPAPSSQPGSNARLPTKGYDLPRLGDLGVPTVPQTWSDYR